MRVLAISGLIALLSLIPGRTWAFGNCLDAGYLDAFLEGLAPQPCDDDYYITIRASTGDALLRVIHLASDPRGPTENWRPQVEALASGVGRAIDALGTGRLPREITVFLTSATDSDPTLGEVHADAARIPGGECRVTFYKLAGGASPAEFTFTTAHEIFHCVQNETWPDAARVDEAGWWAEGSAEYFAHLAAPDAGGGQGWIDAFDTDSLRLSLTEMEYQNVVFFAWLGDAGGPSAVGTFLARMRPGDQLSLLQGLVPQSDWIRFVEAWLDGQIALPGGRAIQPGPMATGEKVFTASGDLTLRAKPYAIDRWGATFPEGKRFDLTHATTGAGHMAMKILNSSDPWADPPEKINTCDEGQRHILYLTSTDGDSDATLTVTTDEDTTGGTCCLIGEWQPTPETLSGLATFGMDYGAAAVAGAGGSMACEHNGGDWRLRFADDTTGSITFDAHATRCTVRAQGGAMASIGVRNGHTDFTWSVRGEGNAAVRYTGHEVAWTNTIKIGPVSQTMTGNDDGPTSLPSGFAFTCEGDSLTVLGIYGLSTYEATHTRIPVP